jgi:uncharacterized membrane protein
MRLKVFYQNHKTKIILGIFSILIGILILGCVFLPSIFYNHFIWKYFWGPIVSDINGQPAIFDGVLAEKKYTLVSEIIYGLLVIVVIFGLYKLLKRWNVNVDWRFCLSILPYIIVGSITRVLEDSKFFNEPLVYWFVTPLIYINILFWVLIILLIGYYLQQRYDKKYITVNSVLFSGGILLLLPFLFFTLKWFVEIQSQIIYSTRFDVFFLILGIVSLIIILLYAISRFFKEYKFTNIYSEPLNLAMIFGHMIDGITSYISIYDPLHMGLPQYIEKHPASDFLMEIWPPLFPIVKFLLIILIIYIFDVLYKEELYEHRCLINLLKIGIFILGFAPGLRDILRVTMGV